MTKNILIFGGSITYGAWDIANGGWAQRLRSYLEKNYELQDYFVYNFGIPGDTSSLVLERLETDMKYRVDKDEQNVVIFATGTNDSAFLEKENKQMTEIAVFKDNLEKLFNQASKYSDKIIFIGLTTVNQPMVSPIPWKPNIFYNNQNILQYNQIIKDFCQAKNILFIDLYDKVATDNLVDGIHPDEQGHEIMFQVIKDNLIKNNII
jgi:lysophospholipase L1-like esterase